MVDDAIREYHAALGPKWRAFRERLADAEHPMDPAATGPGIHEPWFKLVRHLDEVAAAYVAWQVDGVSINGWTSVDDERLRELIEPCLRSDSDKRVFLLTCQRLAAEWRVFRRRRTEENSPE